MRRRFLTTFYFFFFTLACTAQTPQASLQNTFYLYRFSPSAFIEISNDFQVRAEIPFSIPANCGLFNVFPSPVGEFLAVELSCPNGQTTLLLDTNTAAVSQPINDSDSHFLAWAPDGQSAYLKVDSLGNAHIARVNVDGENEFVPVTEFTYDVAPASKQAEFIFTFSRGLGQGSELWLAKRDGKVVELLYSDPLNYISFARYSPTGEQIAFIKIPDTQTPFTVGELWVMNQDGSHARKVAEADAGHGYAANWSPDGRRIAFVVRENPQEERADQSSEALVSNIYVVNVQSGGLTQITKFEEGRAETPYWSPDGNTLAFNTVINDRMQVQIAEMATGEIRALPIEPACCPAWMRK